MVVQGVSRAVGIDHGKVDVVDQGFGGRGGPGIVAPDQTHRQIGVLRLIEEVGDGLAVAYAVFLELHFAVGGLQAFLHVDVPVPFHGIGARLRDLLEVRILPGIKRAGAAEHHGLDQRGAGRRDAALFYEIIADDGRAAGGHRRRHARAVELGVILGADAGRFPAGFAGIYRGARGRDVRLDAPVGARAAAGEESHALVESVVGFGLRRRHRTVVFGSAHRDNVLGAGAGSQLAFGRKIQLAVVVSGGEADRVILVVPDKRVVGAALAAVGAAGAAAPAVVHDSGARVVGAFQFGIRADVEAGCASAGQNIDRGPGRHAAELSVAGRACAAGSARHVRSMPAVVIPAAGAAVPGSAAGDASYDPLVFEVRVDVVDVAVVKAGVMDAYHLRGAVVSPHTQILQIAAMGGARHVVKKDRVCVALDGCDLAHFGELFDLCVRKVRRDSRADSLRFDSVFHAILFQSLLDDRKKLVPGHRYKNIAGIGSGSHAVSFVVEFADCFVFRQKFAKVDERNIRPKFCDLLFRSLQDIGVGRNVAVNAETEF